MPKVEFFEFIEIKQEPTISPNIIKTSSKQLNSQEKSCRSCVQVYNLEHQSLFGYYEKELIADMFYYCTGVKVSFSVYCCSFKNLKIFSFKVTDEDSLPQYICKSCFTHLRVAYIFKKATLDTQSVLVKQKSIQIK